MHDEPCRSCRLVESDTHPDVSVVEPEGATSLGVEQIRNVVTRAALRPVEGRRAIFLLPDAGSMTEQAANALLKTLEEPAPAAIFLLVAVSEEDFPPTVASRCRTVHVGRVPLDVMIEALVDRGMDADDASVVSVVSGGRPGLALALMDQPEVSDFRDLWLSIPGQVTPHPGDGQRLAMLVLEEIGPLARPLGVIGDDQRGPAANPAPGRASAIGQRVRDPGLLVLGLGLAATRRPGEERRPVAGRLHRGHPAQGSGRRRSTSSTRWSTSRAACVGSWCWPACSPGLGSQD